MGVNAASFASNKSGFKKNGRSAVVLFLPINLSSLISHLCVSFSENVFLWAYLSLVLPASSAAIMCSNVCSSRTISSLISTSTHMQSLNGDGRHVFVQGDIGDSALVNGIVAKHQPRAIVSFAVEKYVDRSSIEEVIAWISWSQVVPVISGHTLALNCLVRVIKWSFSTIFPIATPKHCAV